MRIRPVLPALVLCLCAAAAHGQGDYSAAKPFSPNGTVVINMNVGDLSIQPSGDNQIRLQIHSSRPLSQSEMASWVRQFQVAANRATLDLHLPKNQTDCNNCDLHVSLYIPQQADLKVDLGVGDLTIQGLGGDEDAHTGIGDLHIVLPDAASIGHVETHTRIGDVHDGLNQQGSQSGFLGKSEDFALTGLHHLKASAGIGDVHIRRAGNS